MESAAAVLGDTCVGAASGRCAMENGRLVLSGLDLVPEAPGQDVYRPHTSPPVGLLVTDLSVPLIIENVRLTGFWIGIEVRDTCADCDIEVRGSHIEAIFTAVRIGREGAAQGDLALVESRIVAIDTPPTSRLTLYDVAGVGIQAGHLRHGGFEGDLTLDAVIMEAMGSALGPALGSNLTQGARFTARNVTVLGYENALIVGGPHVDARLSDLSVDCRVEPYYVTEVTARAVAIPGTGPVQMDRVDVRNCGWPEDCLPQCGEAIRIGAPGGGITNPTAGAVLRNLTLINNTSYGFTITQRTTVVVEDALVAGGREGAGEISAIELRMRNATFRDLGWRAAFVSIDRLFMDRVVFEGNGHHNEQDGLAFSGGLTVNGYGSPLEIRNSSFVGNEPFGLSSGRQTVDASNNWWGSPLGPSVLTRLPGLGDATDGAVMARPHLTAPP